MDNFITLGKLLDRLRLTSPGFIVLLLRGLGVAIEVTFGDLEQG